MAMNNLPDNKGKEETVFSASLRLIVMVFKAGKKQIVAQLFLRIICGLLPAITAIIWQRILSSHQLEGSQQSRALQRKYF